MEATVGFSTSNRSRIYLERFFTCSALCYTMTVNFGLLVDFALCCTKSEIGKYFCIHSHNQQCYDKIRATTRFNALQRSKIYLERFFNCITLHYTMSFELSVNFALCYTKSEIREYFCICSYNQQCFDKMKAI